MTQRSEAEGLKPCPFCDSTDGPCFDMAKGKTSESWWVECWDCGMVSPRMSTQKSAASKYNDRPKPVSAYRALPAMGEKKTCGFCRWSTLLKASPGYFPAIICELPEGFLMDSEVPDNFGCNSFEPMPAKEEK